jgi:NAD(P)-dependent dehydrogenase (short-subunit alcohol dehydrogenase family)
VDIDGKVAVVTGGARETGRAIALRLAAEGATVVIADVNAEHAEATVREIEEAQGGRTVSASDIEARRGRTASASDIEARRRRAAFVVTDMTDDEAVRRMISLAGQGAGGPHILVNNTGGWGEANYPEATVEQWSRTLDLNLRAAMLATQLALAPMRAAGGGAVVNIASTAGIASDAYASPEYGAAKAGLIRFTTSLADLPGVRVNCIVPDWIATERGQAELARMTPDERAQAPEQVPMEEIADTVVELIRDDALSGRVALLRGREPRRFLP